MSAAVAVKKPATDANYYEPRGAAQALWKCKDPEILIEGPAGTGKTRGVLEKIVALAVKYAGSRHLICRKTRASMTESVLVTLEEKVLPPGSPALLGPKRTQRHSYTFANGSSIVVGGLDQPTRTYSTEYDTLALFEGVEATEDDWESLHRSLRHGAMPYHQAIADSNPGPPTHWLNQRANAGRMTRLLSKHEDNPLLWDLKAERWTPRGEEYIARLNALTGVRRLRLRLGKWAAAEGTIYEEFDASVHVVNRFAIPTDWRRIRVIDFGYVNPFVCQWWAFDHDGRMYLYREIYHTQRLVSDHAVKIAELSIGENIEETVCDHDAEDRATLRRCGIASLAANKAVTPGIQAVQGRLKDAGDGRRRLYLLRDSLVEPDPALIDAKKPYSTEQEFDGYVWAKGSDGRPLKEEPHKLDDHGMDAMRYGAMYRPARRVAGQVLLMS